MAMLYYDFLESRVLLFFMFASYVPTTFSGTQHRRNSIKNLWHFNDHQQVNDEHLLHAKNSTLYDGMWYNALGQLQSGWKAKHI